MKRKNIAAANWKMNKTEIETAEFFNSLNEKALDSSSCEIIISPSFLSLHQALKLANKKNISIAAQNCHFEKSGAFTGEVSPIFLKEIGVSHVILGHSERRNYFHEDNSTIRKKIQSAIEEQLIPIFCIGETLEEREAGKIEVVLETQILEGLQGIEVSPQNMIIAYEPVWAIGTGKVASKEDAQSAHSFVRAILGREYSTEIAQGIRILYGGSAKPENIDELIAQEDIDGALIGGASLKVDSYWSMIESIGR